MSRHDVALSNGQNADRDALMAAPGSHDKDNEI